MTYTGWTAGQTVTSGGLNAMVGLWTAYTPTWTASVTNPVLNNGAITGKYVLIGTTVHFGIMLTAGSTTTFGSGTYSFSLPPGVVTGTMDVIGNVFIGDASVGAAGYTASALAYIPGGSSTFTMYVGAADASSAVTNTNPQTFANGDRIWVTGTCETT